MKQVFFFVVVLPLFPDLIYLFEVQGLPCFENVFYLVAFFLIFLECSATITAARIYSGQKSGRSGEESTLSFEKFPFTGLSKVV